MSLDGASRLHLYEAEFEGDVMGERRARDVVEELIKRQEGGDGAVLDGLIVEDMVNHGAGPQGCDGLRLILRTIDGDLDPVSFEQLRSA